MWISFGSLLLLLVGITDVHGQVSISSLRAAAESSNLTVVTLQGVVRLTRPHQQELGGNCGGTAFTLTDDTGSIEVAVRRVNRLIEPLRDGDRVQVTAQVEVYRTRDNIPFRVCDEAREIQHMVR